MRRKRTPEFPDASFNVYRDERIVEARTISVMEGKKKYLLHVLVTAGSTGRRRASVVAPEGVPLRWKDDKSYGLTLRSRNVETAVAAFLDDVRVDPNKKKGPRPVFMPGIKKERARGR